MTSLACFVSLADFTENIEFSVVTDATVTNGIDALQNEFSLRSIIENTPT
jgi:hypothetical protein